MTDGAIVLPPLRVAAAMLRDTTEALAREVVEPSSSTPQWSDIEWTIARAAAAMQGISTLLSNTCGWSGPTFWHSFLADQRHQSFLSWQKAESLLGRIDEALQQGNIGAVALKGSAIRRLAIYAPGERPMSDVDLLVNASDAGLVGQSLGSIGYVRTFTSSRHAVFEPGTKRVTLSNGEHADNPLKIEVHIGIAEALPIRQVDITKEIRGSDDRPGLRMYPSIASLLLHMSLHAAGNMRAHAARQIQFQDIALLAPNLDSLGWRAYLVDPDSGRPRWWLYPPLAMTERYFAGAVPSDVIRESKRACPRRLRRWVERRSLTDISWSNLRIHAFPGISWSPTPIDALRFVRSRALPGRSALKELETFVKHNKNAREVDWYGMSHARRIARWLCSYPPRVQTMASLNAAIDSVNAER